MIIYYNLDWDYEKGEEINEAEILYRDIYIFSASIETAESVFEDIVALFTNSSPCSDC